MGIRGIAAACALSVSMLCAGTAGEGKKPKAPGEESAADDASKRICRNMIVSGSRLSTRSCRTKAAWDKDGERAQRHVEELQTDFSAKDGGANSYGTTGSSTPR
jgi:hypothetical protein